MHNLQIGTTKPKRSVQSLIQDSAIDHQPQTINFQILQMKKAYNQTYKSFNSKIQAMETELNKYKEKCKKLEEANYNLAQKFMDVDQKNTQYAQMKLYCEKMKRKVAYIEGKYLALKENRSLLQENEINKEEEEPDHSHDKWTVANQSGSKADRNEVYKEISDLIAAKVKTFTKEIRLFPMTKDLQLKIQAFLEELLYITPVSGIDGIKFTGVKEKQVGKIHLRESSDTVLLTEQKAWKDLSKSIQSGEKQLSQASSTALKKKQNMFNYQLSKKAGIRGRSPLSSYNNQQAEERTPEYRPSPKKTKIFS